MDKEYDNLISYVKSVKKKNNSCEHLRFTKWCFDVVWHFSDCLKYLRSEIFGGNTHISENNEEQKVDILHRQYN